MFYEPHKKNHGLPHDPFKAIVAPRPIGWITSRSTQGEINLAPYSFFNAVSTEPPIVMFSSDGRKDSVTFIEETGEFVCNLATWDLRGQMNMTSATYPRGTNEMREVLWISPDQMTADGRWFWGEYQEFGVDVHMERASDGPMLIGADRSSLKSGAQDTIRLFGDRLRVPRRYRGD